MKILGGTMKILGGSTMNNPNVKNLKQDSDYWKLDSMLKLIIYTGALMCVVGTCIIMILQPFMSLECEYDSSRMSGHEISFHNPQYGTAIMTNPIIVSVTYVCLYPYNFECAVGTLLFGRS